MVTPDDVLDFWFGDGGWSNQEMWFMAGRTLDPVVRERFQGTVDAAVAGELEHWAETAQGRLALILVLDQFTRHVYRDDPRFVSGDDAACRHALALLDSGEETELESQHLMFVLTVLEHQENADTQRRALAEVRRLAVQHPELAAMEEYVQDHADIVFRFGRLPDRNHLLGRPSTPEETSFLQEESRPWFEAQDTTPNVGQ